MTTTLQAAPGLSIGDLARRTGLTAATLRMWETRHGFPEAHRLDSGHRRYDEGTVTMVQQVIRRRDAGIRLEIAVAEARAMTAPETPSVFAEVRRLHPAVETHRLRKSTLLALSWALEDECCARAQRATLFGSFQEARFFKPARPRWEELARVARSTMALADFDGPGPLGQRTIQVPLAPDAPMRREWVVVCDAPDLPALLTAWELPGQSEVPDRHRLFESMWTVDPHAVRSAARICALVAQEAGIAEATPLLYELAGDPAPLHTDVTAATTLFNRVVAYVDRLGV